MTAPSQQDPHAEVFRAGLTFGFFNATNWMISLGTPMVLLAEQLGASTFQVGLAYSWVYLLLPVQVLATAYLPHYGYRAQMVFAWSSRNLFLLVPLFIAVLAPRTPSPQLAWLLVLSVFGFCFCRSLGSSAWLPWIYQLLPEEKRGRYFANDQTISGIASVGTLLLCGLCFASLERYPAFTVVYAFAVVGALLAVKALQRLPDTSRPPPTRMTEVLALAPRLCLSPGIFRGYLVVSLAYTAVTAVFTPFVIYYLAAVDGRSQDEVLAIAALQYFGVILGGLYTRSRIDRQDPRRWFLAHLILMGATGIYWLLHLRGVPGLGPLLPLTCFTAGLAVALWNAAHLKYLAHVCPGEDRHLPLSVHSAVVGLLGGLAPTLWGLFLRESGPTPGMNLDVFALYFGSGLIIQAGLWFACSRLPAIDPTTASLPGFGLLFRPFRALAGFVPPLRAQRPPESPSPGRLAGSTSTRTDVTRGPSTANTVKRRRP